MIFVPTIAMTKSLHRFLSLFEKCFYCSSETENKDEIIEKFKSMKNGLCISTTILERGVTIPNVNVCVFEASHYVFSLASLIQMAGRVGRNYLYPTGSVIFLASQKSKKITDCIKEIERANSL